MLILSDKRIQGGYLGSFGFNGRNYAYTTFTDSWCCGSFRLRWYTLISGVLDYLFIKRVFWGLVVKLVLSVCH